MLSTGFQLPKNSANTIRIPIQKMAEDHSDNDSDESDFDAFPRFRAYPKIGKYQPTKILGQGGMGTVYLAEQTDPIVRKVAIKVINPGRDSKDFLQRFDAERRALALMDHEFIARILDADVTKTGQPYYVMEFVEGSSLVEFCDKSQLSIPERLNLFLDVCRGIEHAHQKAILHRDLKPANILVDATTQTPKPKIIDFGLVKALDNGTILARTDKTEMGQLLGSLEYMSPEQAALGEVDVDTRSDVYSLGVVLFELLTGTTPFRDTETRKTSLLDLLEQIRNGKETRTLSQAISESTVNIESLSKTRGLTSKRLRQLVSGDLEIIVSKATSSDRERRYKSISRFADDIKNYLENKPIEARKASKLYLAKRFCQRNLIPIATVTAFGLLLAIAVAISGYFIMEADFERKISEDSKRRVKSLERVEGLVLHSPMWSANDPRRNELIDLLETEYRGWANRTNDPAKDIPEIAIALARFGEQRLIVGQYPQAIRNLEASDLILRMYAKSIEPEELRICIAFVSSLKLRISIQKDDSADLQRVAKSEIEKIIGETSFPTTSEWKNIVFGDALYGYSYFLFDSESKMSYENFSKGTQYFRSLTQEFPANLDYWLLLAKFENMRAKSLHKGRADEQNATQYGKNEVVLAIFDNAESMAKRLIDDQFKLGETVKLRADIISNRGLRLVSIDQERGLKSSARVMKNYQTGIAICNEQLEKFPKNVIFKSMKGRLLLNMANAYVIFANISIEEKFRIEAGAVLNDVVESVPTIGEMAIDHASNEAFYVLNLYRQGRFREAYEIAKGFCEPGRRFPEDDKLPMLLLDSILLNTTMLTDKLMIQEIRRRREKNFREIILSDSVHSRRHWELVSFAPEFEDFRANMIYWPLWFRAVVRREFARKSNGFSELNVEPNQKFEEN